MKSPTLKITKDFLNQFNEVVKKFQKDEVLVGIPASETKRKKAEDEDPGINNATILAINNFGSPLNHIPPRPVMAIGIRNAQKEIAEQFKLAAQTVLTKGSAALNLYYDRAGMIAANSIKKTINSQEGIKKPADKTIALRREKGFKGTKALIVTGQMRNAITWVLRDGSN